MMRTLLPVLLITFLGGCLDSPAATTTPTSEPLSRDWDFRGERGNLSRHFENIGWIHVVLASPGGLREEDVQFRIRWDFSATRHGPQGYLEYRGQPFEGIGGGAPSQREQCRHPPQSESPWEGCADRDFVTEREFTGVSVEHNHGEAVERGIERPVFHYFAAVLDAPQPYTVEVEASWNNTVLNMTYGPPEDLGIYFLDDFERNDTTNRKLDLEAPPGRFFGFSFLVRPVQVTLREAGFPRPPFYERPNGTAESLREVETAEFSSLAGKWTFNVPDENTDITQDFAVLLTVSFDKALLPVNAKTKNEPPSAS